MAKGVKMPVKASEAGGTELERDSSQNQKILRLALAPGDDDNPFQNLGIRESAVHQSTDQLAITEARLEIERILKKLKRKIAIKSDEPIRIIKEDQGIKAQFTWIDLETNEENEFSDFLDRLGDN